MYKDIYQVIEKLEKEFGFKFKKSNYVVDKKEEKINDSIIFRKHSYKDGCKFIFVIFTNWHHMEPEKSNIHCELEILDPYSRSYRYEQLNSMEDLNRFIKMTKYDYFYYYRINRKRFGISFGISSINRKIRILERELIKVEKQLYKKPKDAAFILMRNSLLFLIEEQLKKLQEKKENENSVK